MEVIFMSSVPLSESILVSIKQALIGSEIGEEYTAFDAELILHINSVFNNLRILGIGKAFSISDSSSTWEDYVSYIDDVALIKQYIVLKVKLVFDPPANSFLVNAIEKQIKEIEWYLTVISDNLEEI
jgi:hypothetical protein